MSFIKPNQLKELVHFARIADREARSDLAIGFIRNEDDYTSNFTGALRRIINSNSSTGLTATSFLLKPDEERLVGADAAIILSNGVASKVAIFEGKWPRFGTPNYPWDYPQTASGLSHFSDQLDRQCQFNSVFAIFEMFYCELQFGKQPTYLQHDLSSCVWHRDAQAFKSARGAPNDLWHQKELEALIKAHPLHIGDVMLAFGRCSAGKPISIPDPIGLVSEFRINMPVLAILAPSNKND